MRSIFRRKPVSTPLDVLGDAPAMWPTMPEGDPDSDLSADEAYDTLPISLASQTPVLARLVADRLAAGTLPAGVA